MTALWPMGLLRRRRLERERRLAEDRRRTAGRLARYAPPMELAEHPIDSPDTYPTLEGADG